MMGNFCPRCHSMVNPMAPKCPGCGLSRNNLEESNQATLDFSSSMRRKKEPEIHSNMEAPFMPYEPRGCQMMIIEDIVKALGEKKHIVMESGTGTGKTIVSLAGALQHASDTGKTIVYLTRTISQSDQVMRELRAISKLKPTMGIAITGRGKSCPLFQGLKDFDQIPSNVLSMMCEDARARSRTGKAGGCRYYDRIDMSINKVEDYVRSNLPTSDELDSYCKNLQVCPYEAKKALMKNARVVAAPYIHILDPDIRESLMNNLDRPGDPQSILIVVDEAHNLVDASRESESFSIDRTLVDDAIDECTTFKGMPKVGTGIGLKDFFNHVKVCIRAVAVDLIPLGQGTAVIKGPAIEDMLRKKFDLTDESLEAVLNDAIEIGEERTEALMEAGDNSVSSIQTLSSLLLSWCSSASERFVRTIKTDEHGEYLRAYCIDPNEISKFLYSTSGAIHMSGTLQPLDQYARVLGLPSNSVFRKYPSPFPKENRKVVYTPYLTTRMNDMKNDPTLKTRLQSTIADLCNAVHKNTLVFFTSYRSMDSMRGYLETHIDRKLYWEERRRAQSNASNLSLFRSRRDGVLFCVMGGKFAEGIDFPGDELCFAIIVGIPYPPPSPELDAMSAMFDERYGAGKGWLYCSAVPAQRKMKQAIGRLIRTETDRGMAVILDERASKYRKELDATETTDPVGDARMFFEGHRCEYLNTSHRCTPTMALVNALCDVKIWIALGIVFALAFGFDSPNASTILVFVLIAQMAVSLDGLKFKKDDFKHYDRQILYCLLCCFGINTIFTLGVGLFFIDDSHLWTGWVMLSSVPCAISVVVTSLVMKGDTKMCVLSLTVIYLCAMVLTPCITTALLGSSVNPLEVLRYIVMFIAIPFALSFIVKKLHLKTTSKSIFINVMMLLMVFIGLGSRRDFIFEDYITVMWLILACIIRIFAVSFAAAIIMRRHGAKRENAMVYLPMIAWKNSGMSISITMALFAATMPDAVLPCVVSLVMESVWFAVISKAIVKIWPLSEEEPRTIASPQ